MPIFNRQYSVLEIKTMIRDSEARPSPFSANSSGLGNAGHASRDHHDISDSDIVTKGKSAFIISAAITGGAVTVRTSSDQSFMIARILNSEFGQACLAKLNPSRFRRIVMHCKPAASVGGAEFNMRVKQGGAVNSSGQVQHVVLVIDNGPFVDGKPVLHFVTGYPTNSANYKFKFGPQIPRTRPGVELYVRNPAGGGQQKGLFLWGSDDQEEDSRLQLILGPI